MTDTTDVQTSLRRINDEMLELINKKKAERVPNTFSILYREGAILHREGEDSSCLDYSSYFLHELERRNGKSVDDELGIRTNPLTYDMYLEQ
jgi:uncharacterized alpha/beta hydrolase family protein